MPGTVKSELLSDADRSHKCDSQEKVCWMMYLPLDKSHFITASLKHRRPGLQAARSISALRLGFQSKKGKIFGKGLTVNFVYSFFSKKPTLEARQC